MDNTRTLDRNLDTVAWGAFFVWWGFVELFTGLPDGVGAIGIGVIWLGLNAARSLQGVPTSGFTITLGILALVLGGLELAGAMLSLPFDLPVFAILLIVLGVILLGQWLAGPRSE